MRILIAEDDHTSRAVLAGVLKKTGHEVVETADGTAAWEALQRPDAPRLAILDRMMPGLDGMEVLRLLRARERLPEPYVIMLTARGGKGDIITGLEAGANDYVSKPFAPEELCARIEVGRRMIEMQDALLASREALEHQATHDVLTGMLNRRAILERLGQELDRGERLGTGLAVGICDIDRFKLVNDTHGHQTGDDVLLGLGKALAANLRSYDSVGRLGGEEFLILAATQDGMEPMALFERLRHGIAETPFPTRSGSLPVTVSIGVACTDGPCSPDEILEAADRALYQAKAQGRNQVVAAPPTGTQRSNLLP
jgi:diguanylate cyclase (GGDEF)-like protein